MRDLYLDDIPIPQELPIFASEAFLETEQPAECSACLDIGFIYRQSDSSYITAECCTCKTGQDMNYTSRQKHDMEFPGFVQSIKIPNLFLDIIVKEDFDSRIKKWIRGYLDGDKQNNALFLTGGTGTGKSAASCGAAATLLKVKRAETDCLKINCTEILNAWNLSEGRKQSNTFTQQAKHETRSSLNSYKYLLERINTCELLILDELGQEKIGKKDESVIFDIIDRRIGSCKPSIFISNHAFDRDKSLKKATIDRFLGERIYSRLNACQHLHFTGVDQRTLRKQFTEAEKEGFMFSVPILQQQDNERQMPSFMSRNPIFENVSKSRRSALTSINTRGEEADKDREVETLVENAWFKGAILRLNGPICDHEDKILYSQLLKMLSLQHDDGKSGLSLQTTITELLKYVGLNSSSGSTIRLIWRRLKRLNRMNIDYEDNSGNRWFGPLLASVKKESSGILAIKFQEEMIYFYNKNSYFDFKINLTKYLKGDESSLYFFLRTQLDKHGRAENKYTSQESLIKLVKIMALEKITETKVRNRRIRNAVVGLRNKGLIDEKSYFTRGKLYAPILNPDTYLA